MFRVTTRERKVYNIDEENVESVLDIFYRQHIGVIISVVNIREELKGQFDSESNQEDLVEPHSSSEDPERWSTIASYWRQYSEYLEDKIIKDLK